MPTFVIVAFATVGRWIFPRPQRIAPLLWNRAVNWMISQQFVMSLLVVPYPQRKLVEAQHSLDWSIGFCRTP